MITTARLRLVPVVRAHLDAFAKGRPAFAAFLGFAIPEGWPTFPEAFLPEHFVELPPGVVHWSGFLFLGADSLVGNGGFKGPPNEHGEVELGYEIAPSFRRKGLATEATEALVRAAFSVPEVKLVSAHTLANDPASSGVLRRAGMSQVGSLQDPDAGEVWRWTIARER